MSKTIGVANYFIEKAKKEGSSDLTNKKIQKLLYYAQAWNLVFYEEKLFRDNFEAWIHGPAIPSLYRKLKVYGFNPITEVIDDSKGNELSKREEELLDEIWKVYGCRDVEYLEILTHKEEPWRKARAGLNDFEKSGNIISTDIMMKYYGKRQKEAKEREKRAS